MGPRRKSNPYAAQLARIAKALAKSRPDKLHGPLLQAFVIVAAAGDVRGATRIVEWMYGPRTPAPTTVASALSTSAIDGFCHAAHLGDRTGGLPRHERTGIGQGPLAERVAEAERTVRRRVTQNAYTGEAPRDDAWMKKAADDPWRQIDRWRRIQCLVQDGEERDALRRLADLLNDLPRDARGAGHGDELVLALDLALRHGHEAHIPAWLARHGHRFAREAFLLETALCFPALAASMAEGLLRETIGLLQDELETALAAFDQAIDAANSAPSKRIPKVQRRRVTAEYSQVHLGPETLEATEQGQVHFQNPEDSARGMSIFPTTVGIATPSNTDYVDAEITLSNEVLPTLTGVAQAVSFPLTVRERLVLASVSSTDDEPLFVPPGAYDVLARFVPKKAPRASASAGLRVFKLLLSFHPAGTLAAPRTLRMEGCSEREIHGPE